MATQTNSKVPQIRFKGFEGEWKELAVGSVIEDYIEKTVVQNQYPVLTSSQKQGIVMQKDYFANRQVTTDSNVGYFVIPKGYFSYRSRSDTDTFVFNRNDIIDKGIISYYYPVFKVKNCDSDFFLRRINFGVQQQLSRAAEGTGQRVLAHSNFKQLLTNYPILPEQSQIGAYLKELDRMLGLHQRKHDKLVTLKQAMLQKMFPQNDATTPEIRFKGFEGDWVEKKLKHLSKKVTDKNVSKEYSETLTNSAELGIISQRDYFNKDISNSDNIGGYYVVEPEDFVYNPRISTLAPCGPVSRNTLGRAGVMSPLYTVFRTQHVDNTFLEYFFKTNQWHPFMFLNGDTGARADRFSIKDSVFIELPIPSPSIEEQQKIGSYFRKLDTLMTKHATQLTQLKQIKSACLEQMFV